MECVSKGSPETQDQEGCEYMYYMHTIHTHMHTHNCVGKEMQRQVQRDTALAAFLIAVAKYPIRSNLRKYFF